MFRSPLRPSSDQLLQIVRLQCAYNMGSHNVYIILYIWTKITLEDGTCLTCYELYRSHPAVCQYNSIAIELATLNCVNFNINCCV